MNSNRADEHSWISYNSCQRTCYNVNLPELYVFLFIVRFGRILPYSFPYQVSASLAELPLFFILSLSKLSMSSSTNALQPLAVGETAFIVRRGFPLKESSRFVS